MPTKEEKIRVAYTGPIDDKKFYNKRPCSADGNDRHKFLKRGIDRCQIQTGASALDLGCGCGITTLYIGQSGAKVVGVDQADKLIEYANKHNKNDNVSYIVADIPTLSLDKEFDYVFLADVLEHIDAKKYPQVLSMLQKHTHPGSVIYINLPCKHFQRYGRDRFPQQPIDNELDFGMTTALLEAIGFVPIVMETYGIFGPAEYMETIFISLTHLNNVWDEVYSEASVEDVTDVP